MGDDYGDINHEISTDISTPVYPDNIHDVVDFLKFC